MGIYNKEYILEFYKSKKKELTPSHEFTKDEKNRILNNLKKLCKTTNTSMISQKRTKALLDKYWMQDAGHPYDGKIYQYKPVQKELNSHIMLYILLNDAPPKYREAVTNITRSIMRQLKSILDWDNVQYSIGNKDEGAIYIQKIDPKDKKE